MGGFGHTAQDNSQPDDARISTRNARYGMFLFVIYLAIYVGFVGLSTFAPKQMEQPLVLGVNLAICYGFFLIVAAMALALVYCYLCRSNNISTDNRALTVGASSDGTNSSGTISVSSNSGGPKGDGS